MCKTEILLREVAARAFEKKEDLTPCQWIERYCSLPAKTSIKSGGYSTSYTPYVRELFNVLANNETQVVTIQKGTQLGLSLFAALSLTYIAAEKQRHAIYYSINKDKVRDFASQKFYPVLFDCEKANGILPTKNLKELLKKTKAEFTNCTVAMESASALSSFKSSSACYVFFDELDSSEDFKGEAPSYKLASDRITSEPIEGKIFYFSSPSDSSSKINKLFLEGSQEYFNIPCPHCNAFKPFKFKQIKWDESTDEKPLTIDERAATAHYVCVECNGKFYDRDKLSLMNKGKWIATNPKANKGNRSFHISSLYSCDLSWSQLAKEFLNAQQSGIESLRHFFNSRLAETFDNIAVNNTFLDIDKIIEVSPAYNKTQLTFHPKFIGLSADVQKDKLYYVIEALDQNLNRYVISYGETPEMDSLERIIYDSRFAFEGNEYVIQWAWIDSNYRKEEVLQLCLKSERFIEPCRGVIKEYGAVDITMSQCPYKQYSLTRYDIKDDLFKTRLITYIIGNKTRQLFLPKDTCAEFKRQLVDERIILKKHNGKFVEAFKDTGRNHYFDCVKYNEAMLDIMQVRLTMEQDASPQVQPLAA